MLLCFCTDWSHLGYLYNSFSSIESSTETSSYPYLLGIELGRTRLCFTRWAMSQNSFLFFNLEEFPCLSFDFGWHLESLLNWNLSYNLHVSYYFLVADSAWTFWQEHSIGSISPVHPKEKKTKTSFCHQGGKALSHGYDGVLFNLFIINELSVRRCLETTWLSYLPSNILLTVQQRSWSLTDSNKWLQLMIFLVDTATASLGFCSSAEAVRQHSRWRHLPHKPDNWSLVLRTDSTELFSGLCTHVRHVLWAHLPALLPTYIMYTHSLTSEFYFKGCSGFKDDGSSDGGNLREGPTL